MQKYCVRLSRVAMQTQFNFRAKRSQSSQQKTTSQRAVTMVTPVGYGV